LKLSKVNKVDISLKQLIDIDTSGGDIDTVDTISNGQILTAYVSAERTDQFRFKNLSSFLAAGTGISLSTTSGVTTISATGGGTGTVTSVQLTAGTGISLSGTNPITSSGNITVTNSSPDQTVTLSTTGTGLAVTGTYPNFTLENTLPETGGSGGMLHGTASGTDTYTVSITGVTAYNDGDAYLIRFTNGNTNAATLNINGLGAVSLYRNNDGPLIGGDIWAGGEMICVYNSTTSGFQCIGTSPNSLFSYVTNDDSVTITKGQPVYAFSGTGNRMTVKLAYNSTDATSAQTVGIVYSTSIAPNQKGFIMMQGLLDGLSTLPTSTWTDGDTVYLGATAGTITPTKPYAPNHLVYLGVVTTASPGSAGRMYVRVQNGYELDEIHNIDLVSTAPVNNDVLVFDTSTTPDLWKPKSISTILGYTPQAQLNGTGFVKATGTTISYDNTTYAPLASPAFTGDPTAPTPSAGDNDTSIATTAFVNTAIQSTSPTVVLFRDYSPASLTGTLTNTLVWSTSVNANVFQTNDLLEIRSFFNSNAANGTTTNFRLYVNTSASLAGATQIGAYANGSGTGNGGYQRNIFVTASGSSGNFRTLPIAANVTNSYGVSSSAIANFTVNTTVTLYFIWAIQLGNTANTASIQGTIATITR